MQKGAISLVLQLIENMIFYWDYSFVDNPTNYTYIFTVYSHPYKFAVYFMQFGGFLFLTSL